MPDNPRPVPPAADPLAAWADLGLRTLDMTLASAQNFELVSRSWQQWLAAMETLWTPAKVLPARNAFGVQHEDIEHAVAHAEEAAEGAGAPRPRHTRKSGARVSAAKPSTAKTSAPKRRSRVG